VRVRWHSSYALWIVPACPNIYRNSKQPQRNIITRVRHRPSPVTGVVHQDLALYSTIQICQLRQPGTTVRRPLVAFFSALRTPSYRGTCHVKPNKRPSKITRNQGQHCRTGCVMVLLRIDKHQVILLSLLAPFDKEDVAGWIEALWDAVAHIKSTGAGGITKPAYRKSPVLSQRKVWIGLSDARCTAVGRRLARLCDERKRSLRCRKRQVAVRRMHAARCHMAAQCGLGMGTFFGCAVCTWFALLCDSQ
jgi:hypothetical protein